MVFFALSLLSTTASRHRISCKQISLMLTSCTKNGFAFDASNIHTPVAVNETEKNWPRNYFSWSHLRRCNIHDTIFCSTRDSHLSLSLSFNCRIQSTSILNTHENTKTKRQIHKNREKKFSDRTKAEFKLRA